MALVRMSFWGSSSDYTILDVTAIALGARITFPSNRRFRVYGVGGGGLYFSTLQLPGTFLGIPGTYEENKDTSFGYYAGGGLEFEFKKPRLGAIPLWIVFGLDYRYWSAKASYPDFGIRDADIGGHFFGASVGFYMRHFRRRGR